MIEHLHWRGDQYKIGIEGQRIAIVGYSHWDDDDNSDPDSTRNCMMKIMSGDWKGRKFRFFTCIRNYFGFTSNEDFWSRVLFFNFLPDVVGGGDARFNLGAEELRNRGKDRFLTILQREKPHKVLVFTTKGWQGCPKTREEIGPPEQPPLELGAEFPGFSWGTYDVDGQITMAFGLRHPQGASRGLMERAVRHILKVPLLA
jgi:hypothetical protein